MQKTIQKIHNKFDTAGEKLLAEAKEILSKPIVVDQNKIERLKNIGFGNTRPIYEHGDKTIKQVEAREIVEAIEYYQTYYPSYKFIAEKQIRQICKKYGLLYGESKNYLGDIPEKNLSEIEAFKLREEDYFEDNNIWSNVFMRNVWGPIVTRSAEGEYTFSFDGPSENPESTTSKQSFKICAPEKDFNLQGYEVKDGYKLIYDPIVIQPVKYKSILGGLIISKWGLEGSDEILINEKKN